MTFIKNPLNGVDQRTIVGYSDDLENRIEEGFNDIDEVLGTVENWKNLPLVNGWTILEGQYARYYKDRNRVYVEGYITGSTNVHFATLPSGYRPDRQLFVPFASSGTAEINQTVYVGGGGTLTFGGTVTGNKYFQFSFRIA